MGKDRYEACESIWRILLVTRDHGYSWTTWGLQKLAMLIGYFQNQKAYRLWEPSANKAVLSRIVKLDGVKQGSRDYNGCEKTKVIENWDEHDTELDTLDHNKRSVPPSHLTEEDAVVPTPMPSDEKNNDQQPE